MIDFILEIARSAGEMSLAAGPELNQDDIEFKSAKDLVTRIDRQVEAHLIDAIRNRFPKHDILGEETGKTGPGSEYCWIIDPIDGTTSFVHGQPFYAISIGLHRNGRAVAGAVNAPRLGEMFHATRGQGAFCNGSPLQVSQRAELIQSVVGTGFACLRADLAHNNLPYFRRIAPRVRGIRRFGSAAIDLAYVAAGRLEAFWELHLQPYDVAAGVLLVEEAGGMVTDLSGGRGHPTAGLVATNGLVHAELLNHFRDVDDD